jgi:hypothetical protein
VKALIALAVALSSVALAPRQAQSARRCNPSGIVLLNRDGLVIWTAPTNHRHPVFACASPSGGVHKLYPDSANPRVTRLTFAGHFVAFFLRTNIEVHSKFLFVYDRIRGRVELRDLAECDGNDECPTFPPIVRFALARDGWVAELYDDFNVVTRRLLATDGGSHHWPLDAAPSLGQLSVSGNALSWKSGLGGASSARLGSDLITSSSPASLSACQLLSSPEASVAVGAGATATAAPGGSCTYSGVAATLSLTSRTGLSGAQLRAAENAVKTQFGFISYPNNEAFQIYINTAGTHEQLAAFTDGAELTFDLAPGDSSTDATLEHLAIVALDRLFGVPIQRTI